MKRPIYTCEKCVNAKNANCFYKNAHCSAHPDYKQHEGKKKMSQGEICRCVECGKRCEGEDDVYPVETLSGYFEFIINPTCSEKCAKAVKDKNVRKIRECLRIVESQAIKKETVKSYFCIK